jgi:hypothetical protein
LGNTSRIESSFAPAASKPATHRGARWPNELVGYLGHLRETNDLFGNLALIWQPCPYLATLLLFGHLARSPAASEKFEEDEM